MCALLLFQRRGTLCGAYYYLLPCSSPVTVKRPLEKEFRVCVCVSKGDLDHLSLLRLNVHRKERKELFESYACYLYTLYSETFL